MSDVFTAMVQGHDPDICGAFCARANLRPSCVEEHEAWHVLWIQAEVE